MLLIKIKELDLLRDGKNISDSIAYFMRVHMICLIFSSASCISSFEYENKESRKSINHTGRSNWSSFKEAPYRNPDMSQQH